MALLALLPTQTTYIEPPMPLPVIATTTPVVVVPVEEEVKDPEQTFPGEECNCYAYVKNRLDVLPPMAAVHPNSAPVVGAVAVEWFGQVKHVSLVTAVGTEGVWVEESNYNHCKKGTRFIPFDKHSLVGFWVAG